MRRQQYVGRHESQRTALKALLVDAVQSLAEQAAALPADTPPGELFDRCRVLDEAAVWLERVWDFYRTKFDQRDDPVTGSVVQAADEVVWSCYHPVMARARGKHRPQPLPFLASEYSPAALESDKPVPAGLRPSLDPPDWTDALRAATSSLPVTLLRLPPWCIQDPWWLVFVAHEVGHHVQADLGLVGPFATRSSRPPPRPAPMRTRRPVGTLGPRDLRGRLLHHDDRPGRRAGGRGGRAQHRAANARRHGGLSAAGRAAGADGARRGAWSASPAGGRRRAIRPARSSRRSPSRCLAQLPVVNRTLIDLCDVQAARFGPTGVVGTWTDRLLDDRHLHGRPHPRHRPVGRRGQPRSVAADRREAGPGRA